METLSDRAVEAYLYLYPLVLMETTRLQATAVPAGRVPGRGPMNTFAHARAFPPAEFRMVVRPNFDTLYSSAWLDLTEGPVVVSAPDTHGRYHMLPMLDMWTDVFAVPGSRTSGTEAVDLAVVPPGWQGTPARRASTSSRRPPPTSGSSAAPGPTARTTTPRSAPCRTGMAITPLDAWTAGTTPPEPSPHRGPARHRPAHGRRWSWWTASTADAFFALGADLLGRHRPHHSDWSVVRRLRDLGIVPGQPLRPGALDDAGPRGRSTGRPPGRGRSSAGWPATSPTSSTGGR